MRRLKKRLNLTHVFWTVFMWFYSWIANPNLPVLWTITYVIFTDWIWVYYVLVMLANSRSSSMAKNMIVIRHRGWYFVFLVMSYWTRSPWGINCPYLSWRWVSTSATVLLMDFVVWLQISARFVSSTPEMICCTRAWSTPTTSQNRHTYSVLAIQMLEFMWAVVPSEINIEPRWFG